MKTILTENDQPMRNCSQYALSSDAAKQKSTTGGIQNIFKREVVIDVINNAIEQCGQRFNDAKHKFDVFGELTQHHWSGATTYVRRLQSDPYTIKERIETELQRIADQQLAAHEEIQRQHPIVYWLTGMFFFNEDDYTYKHSRLVVRNVCRDVGVELSKEATNEFYKVTFRFSTITSPNHKDSHIFRDDVPINIGYIGDVCHICYINISYCHPTIEQVVYPHKLEYDLQHLTTSAQSIHADSEYITVDDATMRLIRQYGQLEPAQAGCSTT